MRLTPAALLIFSCLTALAAPRKNVLLLVSDDCGARMGTYGGPALTPNIDALARTGVRFDRAYCQYALCNPSRTSFLTGLRPDTTGVYDNAKEFRKVIPDMVTMPQLFKNNGYSVARIGKLYHYGVPKEIGTDGLDDPQSWEKVWNPRGRDCDDEDKIFSIGVGAGSSADKAKGNMGQILVGSGNYGGTLSWLAADGTDAEQTDGKISAQAISFLQQKRSQPFFLAVGFFRPHTPYVAPKSYFRNYPKDKVELVPDPSADRASKPQVALSNTAVANYGMTEDTQRTAKQAYLASMTFMDTQFGLVLAELKRQGLDQNTVVVFISDHGYNLGEHGLWQKRSLYEDSARVPLIIRDPGNPANGRSTKRVAELVDLYPTVADLCDLTPDKRAQGKSLRPVLANPESVWSHAAYTQVDFGAINAGGKKKAATPERKVGRSVRTERYRYTEWNEGRLGVELYDHDADPKELKNLAADPAYASIVSSLKATLAKGTN
ncbi:MAG: sulfatase [Verrucomicrobiota bacterium]